MGERRLRGALGERFQTMTIRCDGLWLRAQWQSRRGANATLNAKGMTFRALIGEILATDAEDAS
jgi:hypothetical protein